MENCAAQYGKAAHEEMLRLEQSHPGSLGLTHGGCRLCAHCARPEGKPCRFPEHMHPCLESYGVVVNEIVEREQMEYNLGGNTILWFSMVLIRK